MWALLTIHFGLLGSPGASAPKAVASFETEAECHRASWDRSLTEKDNLTMQFGGEQFKFLANYYCLQIAAPAIVAAYKPPPVSTFVMGADALPGDECIHNLNRSGAVSVVDQHGRKFLVPHGQWWNYKDGVIAKAASGCGCAK